MGSNESRATLHETGASRDSERHTWWLQRAGGTLIPARVLRRGTSLGNQALVTGGRTSDSLVSQWFCLAPACLSLLHVRAMQHEERPEAPEAPSAPWRAASVFTMGAVGLLCKGFLGLNKIETHGMERFLRLLDERQEPKDRERGLITGMRLQSRKEVYLEG